MNIKKHLKLIIIVITFIYAFIVLFWFNLFDIILYYFIIFYFGIDNETITQFLYQDVVCGNYNPHLMDFCSNYDFLQ